MVDTLGFRLRERGLHDFTLRLREPDIDVPFNQHSALRTQRCVLVDSISPAGQGRDVLAERARTSMDEAFAFRARERASRQPTLRFRESDVAFRRTRLSVDRNAASRHRSSTLDSANPKTAERRRNRSE